MKVSTRNTLIASALAVGLLATGIVVIPQFITAPVVRTDASVAARATARVCPEAVTPGGAHGEPRNAAGQVRYCWPGEAKCQCDSDNDCYALEGYVACIPPSAPTVDAGTRLDVVAVIDRPVAPTLDVVVPRDSGPVARVDVPVIPPVVPPATGIAAFPGAEGFGAAATGGRGGRVIYVTNLNTSGPGSLQDAVQQTGPRYVLFKVSGVINGDVHVRSGDLTVAGQTSPGGIIVRGIDFTEEPYCDQQCGANARGVQNVVLRHLRSRPAGGSFPDALRLRYVRLVVVDHCSLGNAQDEAVEISYANRLTIQDSILAETIGDHAQYGGMLVNYTNPAAGYQLDAITVLRTVWNRIQGRYPELSRESGTAAAGTTMRIELTNNLVWDQRYFIDVNPTVLSGGTSGAAINYQINWVGNSFYARPGTGFGAIWLQRVARSTTTAYFHDNRSSLWPARADWDLNYCCSDYRGGAGTRPSWARSSRHAFPPVAVMPSANVRAYAFGNAGAFPRDVMDRRLMSYVNTGTFDASALNVNPAGDALRQDFTGAGPAAPVDTDADGIPDVWETARGLNPRVQDHNGTQLSVAATGVAGYTNLEVYLHLRALERVAGH